LEIKKLTENNFLLYKESDYWVLELGKITPATDTKTELLISGINTNNFTTEAMCGCTATEKSVIDETTIKFTVEYKRCESSFSKIIVLREGGNKSTKLKIKGTCQTNS
jgi:hypothetical protein